MDMHVCRWRNIDHAGGGPRAKRHIPLCLLPSNSESARYPDTEMREIGNVAYCAQSTNTQHNKSERKKIIITVLKIHFWIFFFCSLALGNWLECVCFDVLLFTGTRALAILPAELVDSNCSLHIGFDHKHWNAKDWNPVQMHKAELCRNIVFWFVISRFRYRMCDVQQILICLPTFTLH